MPASFSPDQPCPPAVRRGAHLPPRTLMTDAATPVWLTGEYATLKFERVDEHDVQ